MKKYNRTDEVNTIQVRECSVLQELFGALPHTPPETLSLDSARKPGFLDLLIQNHIISYEIMCCDRGLGPAAPAGFKGGGP